MTECHATPGYWSQATVHCEDSEACYRKNHGDVYYTMVLDLFIIYYRDHGLVWKHQNTWRDYVVLYAEEKMPLKWVFQLYNDPKHTRSILFSDKKDWDNWVATVQFNPLTSTPLKTCGFTLKMQFLEQNPKIHRNYGIVCSSWVEIPVSRCSWLTQCNDAQLLSKTVVMQLKNL